MKIVGLSGGIATGKSTVAAEIERQNVPLIDCDKIAHAVVKKVIRRPRIEGPFRQWKAAPQTLRYSAGD